MIIGDPHVFAIESEIEHAYVNRGLLALGLFTIVIDSRVYGVRESCATMLACSYDEVARRLKERGRHVSTFASDVPAGEIADAFRRMCYLPSADLNVSDPQVSAEDFYRNGLVWAPDGDEAFDDGSYVLQFDYGSRVRLIAFRTERHGLHDPESLVEKWLAADDYYSVLQRWVNEFNKSWENAQKC